MVEHGYWVPAAVVDGLAGRDEQVTSSTPTKIGRRSASLSGLPCVVVTIDLSGRRIFLASPGDLSPERAVVRETIDETNQLSMETSNVAFITLGWEQTPAGVGRPQGTINEDLRRSDFLLLMLGYKWGSSPADPENRYSSGTMEEFYTAARLLEDEAEAMRDIAVLFKTPPQSQLEDPGPELKTILDFRNMLEETKSLLYGTFDSPASLKQQVQRSLLKWQSETFARKTQKHMPLADPSSIASPAAATGTPAELLAAANEKYRAGLTTQAEQLYSRAASSGDVTAQSELAKFMRRTGRNARATEISEELLSTLDATLETSEIVVARTQTLVNLGIMYRLEGDLNRSLRFLEEARLSVENAKTPYPDLLAYVFDNIAITWDRAGDKAKSAEWNERSREVRSQSDDPVGAASSLTAYASSLVRQKLFDEAIAEYDRAVELLPEDGAAEVRRARARALAGKGKALLRLERGGEAKVALEVALHADEELGDATGTAIVRGLLAEAALVNGDLDEVDRLARLVLEDSQQSGNRTGEATAYWRLGQAASARGNAAAADEYFRVAEEAASAASNMGLLGAITATRLGTVPRG